MSNHSMASLDGKTVLITGAANGIGAAVAARLYSAGANLVLLDLSIDALRRSSGGYADNRVLHFSGSVTDRAALDECVRRAVSRFGGIDIVFANAGIAVDPPATIRTIDEAMFERVIEVDLLGVWRTVRACLPQVVERKGHFLLCASVYAYLSGVGNAPYATSKAGVEAFGRALRAELAGTGATSGVLYPGWINTQLARTALGGNDTVTELLGYLLPGIYRSSITPEVLAEAVHAGIRSRAPRIIAPRRWAPLSWFRGLANIITDRILDRHVRFQTTLRKLEDEYRNRKTRT